MSSQREQQIPLEITRGMLVVMVVVMGIAWFGASGDRPSGRDVRWRGDGFGAWTTPDILPIQGKPVESQALGLRIGAAEGFLFFLLDHPGDGQGPSTISFINRNASILGQIKTFDPSASTWPPTAADFPPSVHLDMGDEDATEPAVLRVGASDDFQLQVQTILYQNATIDWASPRKSSAWPLRVHIGKCALGHRTLLVSVYEMDAQTPSPDYQQGPIAVLAGALAPL
ncbi:hypothetical protein Enr13x_78300 [Stieleria neptunia]|uniref:Uncharacterized protein n=1 Tax=Stieleria neptunia TaxID=2527979 RepID=A0A518I4G5_9BACT|nr:hypothetical protein [Stieleria neptunia]QDV47918.1 hypothetical protein Enr13x_78300 [Stieleria neptunia]